MRCQATALARPILQCDAGDHDQAPPEGVWPWIVQVGYGRAGWYSYDVFDNASRPSAEAILPERQHPKVGDWVPMAAKVNETTAFKIKAFEPNACMLWEKPQSICWKLTPLDDGRTRLVARLKAVYDWHTPGPAVLTLILLEFADFPMMRKMLRGLKARAERRQTVMVGTTQLPQLVRSYLARSLPPDPTMPATVRVQQTGEMWKKPGGRAMAFQATEDFAVERVAFSWRARFPIVGPLAMTVVDEFAKGAGQLRVSLLGIPLQTQEGPQTDIGEAMRYLAELVWAPQAIAFNRSLLWRDVDERTVELECDVAQTHATVRWEFNAVGDPVRATGVRPFPVGKTFERRRWGGDFGEYEDFAGTRVPSLGEAWWAIREGRFVYWRGRITALELMPV